MDQNSLFGALSSLLRLPPPCGKPLSLGTSIQVMLKFKMAAGTYTTRRRRADKSHKNGLSKLKHGLSALQEEKLQDFKDSFVEEFEDTPFQVAVLTYLSYFFLILFGYLRDFMRKYGLERSKAPKESGNEVSYLRNPLFTSSSEKTDGSSQNRHSLHDSLYSFFA